MTGLALRADRFLMWISFFMAIDAAGLRTPVFVFLGMARLAAHRTMLPGQGKTGQLVIEYVLVQMHDVSFSAFVFGMAGCTLRRLNARL